MVDHLKFSSRLTTIMYAHLPRLCRKYSVKDSTELIKIPVPELLRLKGMGRKSFNEYMSVLDSLGIGYKKATAVDTIPNLFEELNELRMCRNNLRRALLAMDNILTRYGIDETP